MHYGEIFALTYFSVHTVTTRQQNKIHLCLAEQVTLTKTPFTEHSPSGLDLPWCKAPALTLDCTPETKKTPYAPWRETHVFGEQPLIFCWTRRQLPSAQW